MQSAQNALDTLACTAANPRLAWLERQLAHIIAQLRGLQDDVDCGWSKSGEGGVFSDCEFEMILDDFAASIANLKSLIQSTKMMVR